MDKAKPTIFYPERCEFYVDTNNLIHIQMFETIINKFDDETIYRLNEVLNGIKFYVGGNHWHKNKKGYIKYPAFEFNFHDRTLLIFLYKIFDLGYKRWIKMLYGSLKRYIWESFCHEIIMSLTHVIKLNLNLAAIANSYYLNEENSFIENFVSELFSYKKNYPLRVNFIGINTLLWHESIPKLRFLEILHHRKLNKLKNVSKASHFDKIKFFNEFRKIKLNYEYEYNLSELVNYCIHNHHFETLCRHYFDKAKFQREFYYKAKRIILKFFKEYDINNELIEYKDSANRIHFFLTHKTFERVKSACLQNCIAKIKNKMLRDYEKFINFYSRCPICKRENQNQSNCERFYFNTEYSFSKEILIDKMNDSNSLEDLNDEDMYFGIPCEKCYQFVRNIQGKLSGLNQVQKFLVNYANCPICGMKNHNSYLLSFYYDESKEHLRNHLIELMQMGNLQNIKLNYGIPCCDCFYKVFEEEPNYSNVDLMF